MDARPDGPEKGPVELVFRFGPSRSPSFARAVEHARLKAGRFRELGPDRYEALFTLADGQVAFAHAHRLLDIVGEWRSTEIDADGVPETPWNVRAMLACGRRFLRTLGRCGIHGGLPTILFERCPICPLLPALHVREDPAALRG